MAGSFGWRLVKLIGALCAGALVGALAGALLLIAVGTIPRGTGSTSAFVPSNLLFTYFIFWFTAPAALVAGLPSFYLLARCRMLNAISVGSVGIFAGAGVNMLLKSGVPSGQRDADLCGHRARVGARGVLLAAAIRDAACGPPECGQPAELDRSCVGRLWRESHWLCPSSCANWWPRSHGSAAPRICSSGFSQINCVSRMRPPPRASFVGC